MGSLQSDLASEASKLTTLPLFPCQARQLSPGSHSRLVGETQEVLSRAALGGAEMSSRGRWGWCESLTALSSHRRPAKLRCDHPHFSGGEAAAREALRKIVLSAGFAPSTSLHHSSAPPHDQWCDCISPERGSDTRQRAWEGLDRFAPPSPTAAPKTIRHGFQTAGRS